MNRAFKKLFIYLLIFFLYVPILSSAESPIQFSLQEKLKFKQYVGGIEYSPDGKVIAIIGFLNPYDFMQSDSDIIIVEAQSFRTLSTLNMPQSIPMSLSFSPDHRQLAIGRWFSDAVIYELKTSKPVLTMKGEMGYLSFFPDSQRLIISDADHQVSIWERGEIIAKRKIKQESTIGSCLMALSPNGKTIAIVRKNLNHELMNNIEICDSSSLKSKTTLKMNSESVSDLVFSTKGDRLITSANEGIIKVWDIKSEKETKSFIAFDNDKWSHVSISQLSISGNLLAISSQYGTEIWNIDTFRLITTLPKSGPFIEFSPDAKTLLTTTKSDGVTGGYNEIQVWKIIHSRANQ